MVLHIAKNITESAEFVLYRCDGCRDICTGNVLMSRKLCQRCRGNGDLLLTLMREALPGRRIYFADDNISQELLREKYKHIDNVSLLCKEDLRKAQLENFELGKAVLGSLICLTQDAQDTQLFRRHLIERISADAIKIYSSCLQILSENKITDVMLFSGRFHEPLAAASAARESSVNVWSFEGYADKHLLTNCGMVQDHSFFVERIRDALSQLDERQIGEVNSWLSERRARGTIYINQEKAMRYSFAESGKVKVLVATSSEDENELLESYVNAKYRQNDFLRAIVHFPPGKYEVIIREHPNQRRKLSYQRVELREIVEDSAARFIPAEDDVNTYELMAQCDIALAYESSVLLETTVIGKQTLSYGDSFYRFMPGFDVCGNPEGLERLVDMVVGQPLSGEKVRSAYAALRLYSLESYDNKHDQFVKTGAGEGYFLVNGKRSHVGRMDLSLRNRVSMLSAGLRNWRVALAILFHRKWGYLLLNIPLARRWFLARERKSASRGRSYAIS